MIINDKRKFFFVCVPKTASTTLSKYFVEADGIVIEKSWYKERWHWPAKTILIQYSGRVHDHVRFEDYFSFAYHRNPWDRLVSSWIEFTQEKGHLMTWSQGLADQYKTFNEFVLDLKKSKWAQTLHFRPSTFYTHREYRVRKDGKNKIKYKQVVNFIAQYSNFDEDTKTIFDKVGLDFSKLPTKKQRKSNRDPDYRKYYTNDEMIETVADLYSADINIHGDKF